MNLLERYFAKTPEQVRSKPAIACLAALDCVFQASPIVASHIIRELIDQRQNLKMIASENYSSLSVQLAMGNWLTDKYAEGFPHHRFYAGCEHVDAIEEVACHHLKELFGAEHAYVQPHSGADANLLAFWAILTSRIQIPELERLQKKSIDELNPQEFEQLRQLLVNQKLLGLSLGSGGHLTHGYRHNLSSKIFQAAFYDVNPATGLLDYDVIRKRAQEERPSILLAGYSAYPRKINFATMRQIADEVGATFMVDMAHFSGLVAGKVFVGDFSPFPHADVVTSTTHKTLRGPRGGVVMSRRQFQEFLDKGCPLVQGGPLPHVIAAKALAFQEALQPSFSDYAHQVVSNAQVLAEALMQKGLKVLTGGTDNHMVLIDVSPLGLTGRQAEQTLRLGHITCNRNSIPFDKNGPWYTSGIRLGTPALTTLGMKQPQMQRIATFVYDLLSNAKPSTTAEGLPSRSTCDVEPKTLERVHAGVRELLEAFPLYPEIDIPETVAMA